MEELTSWLELCSLSHSDFPLDSASALRITENKVVLPVNICQLYSESLAKVV
jgi:hypothetical protein